MNDLEATTAPSGLADQKQEGSRRSRWLRNSSRQTRIKFKKGRAGRKPTPPRGKVSCDSFLGWMGQAVIGQVFRWIDQAGFAGRIMLLTGYRLPRHRRILFHLTLEEVYKLTYNSVFLIILVGFMLGYLWSMLWFGTFSNVGGRENLSSFLVTIHTIQITPIMTTVIAIIRYGAPTTWELAVMKSSRQFETLLIMGIPPEHYLAVPRILGTLLAIPALLALFSLASFVGAYYLAWHFSGQPMWDFIFSLSNQASGEHYIIMGFKSVAISLAVSFFCVYNGFKMGTESLGLGTEIMRKSMGESFFYSVLFSVLVSVLYA